MTPYPFGAVTLDTCPTHGTWFDHDEIERVVLAARGMSEKSKAKADGKEPERSMLDDVWGAAKIVGGGVALPFVVVASLLGTVSTGGDDNDDE